MNLHVFIFNSVQLSYCIIFNNHTQSDLFTQPKKTISMSINVFILISMNEYIYYFFIYDGFINYVTVLSFNLNVHWFTSVLTSFYVCKFSQIVIIIYILNIVVVLNLIKRLFWVQFLFWKRDKCCYLLAPQKRHNKWSCKSAHDLYILMVILKAFNALYHF